LQSQLELAFGTHVRGGHPGLQRPSAGRLKDLRGCGGPLRPL